MPQPKFFNPRSNFSGLKVVRTAKQASLSIHILTLINQVIWTLPLKHKLQVVNLICMQKIVFKLAPLLGHD